MNSTLATEQRIRRCDLWRRRAVARPPECSAKRLLPQQQAASISVLDNLAHRYLATKIQQPASHPLQPAVSGSWTSRPVGQITEISWFFHRLRSLADGAR